MNDLPDIIRDLTVATVKTAPPAIVGALTLNEWVAVATFIYVVLQAAYLLWKWRRELNGKGKGDP